MTTFPLHNFRYAILIRGMEGEAGVSDIHSLRQSVDKLKTDKGCLVAARRVSQAARDEIKKKENEDLSCCNFDELLDQDADFSNYFTWLENEIKRLSIDKGYVPLACIKEEFDPNTKKKIAENSYDEKNGWIEGYIDQWLDDPSKQHISVLGEFGTGKTWFALHYAWKILQEYNEAKSRGIERGRIPLVIPLRDYAKALDVENVLARFFFHKHNLHLNNAVFAQLNRMGKLLLIFDGFDEMASKVDHQKMIDNFWELARVVVPGAKAILTCRNEHFPEAQSGRALLNAELKASTARLTGQAPQFEVLKLKPFNTSQIQNVLSLQTNSASVKRITSDPKLMDLARRPLMIELILEALPDVKAGKKIDMSRIYLYAMQRKMERDIKEERTFTSLIDKLYFMCELSFEMLATEQMSINYKLFPDKIRNLFGLLIQQQKDLDHWRYDMMGQTLLIRNDDGDYSPAHRSFLEFFVAYKFAAELGVLASDFTAMFRDEQNKQLVTTILPDDYTWSHYFRREVDETGMVKSLPYLRRFEVEDINKLAETVGKNPFSVTIWQFLQNMMDTNLEEVKAQLLSIIQETRGKSLEEVGLVGSNVTALLVHLDPLALRNQDLSGTNLYKLNLRFSRTEHDHQYIDDQTVDLSGINLQNANLEQGNFLSSIITLAGANLRFSNLTGIKFSVSQFDCLSFNPLLKEKLITSSSNDIILWDLETRKVLTRVNTDGSWEVQHSPDGGYLVSSKWGGFEVRDPKSLEIIYSLENSKVGKNPSERNNYWTSSFAFSSDSKLLFVGCNDSAIYVWDFKRYQEVAVLLGHTSPIQSLSLSPDEKYLVSRCWHKIIIWDIATNNKVAERNWKGSSGGKAIFHSQKMFIGAIIPNGNPKTSDHIILDGRLHILDPLTLKSLFKFPLENVKLAKYSPNGTLLCISNRDGFVVFDTSTNKPVADVVLGDLNIPFYRPTRDLAKDYPHEKHLGGLYEIAFNATGKFIAAVTHGGYLIIFDTTGMKVTDVFCHLPNMVGADFQHAMGLDTELQKQLVIQSALLEDEETECP